VRSKIATELDGEWVKRARVVVQERRALLADWMSRKSMRSAVLLGVLLTISVAVNAMIIFTDASRQ
jgi:beta-lactamase regulating signal transducer with metallopeptidase domain